MTTRNSAETDPALLAVLLRNWNDIGLKLVKMAEGFPADKYGFRPAPEVRSFAEQLRHVGFWNEYVAKTARGEAADPAPNELAEADYPGKPEIVQVLKRTVADGAAELEKHPPRASAEIVDLWGTFAAHSSEHYGQLVVYYRLNGLVPPATTGS